MKINRRWLAFGATAVALGAVVTGTALAQNDSRPPTAAVEADDVHEDDAEEDDEQVTDPATRERATAAAIEAAGGQGTVTEIELADDGESGYEVEVRKPDGSSVEVVLTDAFEVVEIETEDEDETEDDD